MPSATLTKSDFLLYREAPRHLWAKKHDQIAPTPSDFTQHLIDEGYAVEGLAREYLQSVYLPRRPGADLLWQQTFSDGPFEARTDALVIRPGSGACDLYEIKSATGVDKDDLYDVAFQALVLRSRVPLERCFLLHLNKEYTCQGELDLEQLFSAEDVTEKVAEILPEVEGLRQEALQAAQAPQPDWLAHCLSPRECPCPEVCHPGLPGFSIFDIPRLGPKKKVDLLLRGIRDARDIPPDFDLNAQQRRVAALAVSGAPSLDPRALRAELERLQFPLWFLDYETCIAAVPRYPGYHPQQQIVFQYSLHCLEDPEGEARHAGHISAAPGDPALPLLERLSAALGPAGTVVVWNKTFEKTMNSAMARLHPIHAPFLEDLNARIYDLAEIVSKGIYLHPGFKGSWSLKNVLPAMVPELSYAGMEISHGDQASTAWWGITFGGLDGAEKARKLAALEQYCALDTLAMVEIYRRLRGMLA